MGKAEEGECSLGHERTVSKYTRGEMEREDSRIFRSLSESELKSNQFKVITGGHNVVMINVKHKHKII